MLLGCVCSCSLFVGAAKKNVFFLGQARTTVCKVTPIQQEDLLFETIFFSCSSLRRIWLCLLLLGRLPFAGDDFCYIPLLGSKEIDFTTGRTFSFLQGLNCQWKKTTYWFCSSFKPGYPKKAPSSLLGFLAPDFVASFACGKASYVLSRRLKSVVQNKKQTAPGRRPTVRPRWSQGHPVRGVGLGGPVLVALRGQTRPFFPFPRGPICFPESHQNFRESGRFF